MGGTIWVGLNSFSGVPDNSSVVGRVAANPLGVRDMSGISVLDVVAVATALRFDHSGCCGTWPIKRLFPEPGRGGICEWTVGPCGQEGSFETSCRTPPDSGPGCGGSLPRRGRNTSAQGDALGPRGIPPTPIPQRATQDFRRWRACFALSGQGSGSATCSRGVAPG